MPSLMHTSENNTFSAHGRCDVGNQPLYCVCVCVFFFIIIIIFLFSCTVLKNDQECIIKFKNIRRNVIIHDGEVFEGLIFCTNI